jgi:integrase
MPSLKKQIRHPVTKRRVWITATTQSELDHRVKVIGDMRRDIRAGLVTLDQARAQLAPAIGGRKVLRVLWEDFRQTIGPRSRRSYGHAWSLIEPELGDMPIWELNQSVVAKWENKLLSPSRTRPEGYAPKTVRVCWAILKQLARVTANLDRLPWHGYKSRADKLVAMAEGNAGARRPRQALASREELQRFLAAATELDEEDGGNRFIVCGVLALTGLRQAEAAGLGWDCVRLDTEPPRMAIMYQAPQDWHRDYPSDRPRLPPKNGHDSQNLHPSVVFLLQEQEKRLRALGHYRHDGPVFPAADGSWRLSGRVITPDTFRTIVKRAQLPGEGWVPHSLRHSLATLELQASAGNLRAVARRTRHKSLKILEGYIHQFGGRWGGSHVAPLDMPKQLPQSEPVRLPAQKAVKSLPPNTSEKTGALDRVTLGDLARQFVASGGKPGDEAPRALSGLADAAYQRAYSRAKGQGPQAAQIAGRRARRGVVGAWSSAVRSAMD